MDISARDQQVLQATYQEYKGKFRGCMQDYFPAQYIKKKHHVEIPDIAHQVAFGNNDYGIDAYYVDAKAGNLYLYQAKWTTDYRQFVASFDRLNDVGMQRIFGNGQQDAKQNDMLLHLAKDLEEYRACIKHVYIRFLFKGDPDAADNNEPLAQRKEALEAKRHVITTFFRDPEVKLTVEYIGDRPSVKVTKQSHPYKIHFDGSSTVTHEGRTLRVGFVRLVDLYKIYLGEGLCFFDRNIRATISKETSPNKKVRLAIERIVMAGDTDPSEFAFNHNGVTIAAERVHFDGGVLTLTVPRLLNGAQTVSTLARLTEKKADNPQWVDNRDRLEGIQVVAKIIEDDTASRFVQNVTIANNQQNPVQPWQLRAMDRVQVDLADKFLQAHFFYSRQEGAFEAMTNEEREEIEVGPRDLGILPLAQTFLAIQGEISYMTQMPEVFENQKIYENTFKNRYLNEDVNKIILLYKVGTVINPIIREMKDVIGRTVKSETNRLRLQNVVSRGKTLVQALLIQGLLNDADLKNKIDLFGHDLTRQADFVELLKATAKEKIFPAFVKLIKLPIYAEKIKADKYDFMRSRETFKEAMRVLEKNKWIKKSLRAT